MSNTKKKNVKSNSDNKKTCKCCSSNCIYFSKHLETSPDFEYDKNGVKRLFCPESSICMFDLHDITKWEQCINFKTYDDVKWKFKSIDLKKQNSDICKDNKIINLKNETINNIDLEEELKEELLQKYDNMQDIFNDESYMDLEDEELEKYMETYIKKSDKCINDYFNIYVKMIDKELEKIDLLLEEYSESIIDNSKQILKRQERDIHDLCLQ